MLCRRFTRRTVSYSQRFDTFSAFVMLMFFVLNQGRRFQFFNPAPSPAPDAVAFLTSELWIMESLQSPVSRAHRLVVATLPPSVAGGVIHALLRWK